MPCEDLRLALLAEAGDGGDAAGAGGRLELLDRADGQLVEEAARLLGPQGGEARELEERARHLGQELVAVGERAGRHQLADVPGHLLADPLQVGERRPFGHPPGERHRLRLDRAHRVAVGADAERVLAPDLQGVGHLGEGAGDLDVVHGLGPGGQLCKPGAGGPLRPWTRSLTQRRRRTSASGSVSKRKRLFSPSSTELPTTAT